MKRNYYLAAVGLIAVALAISVILYPELPSRIPTHWNLQGEVDGYTGKPVGAFLGPIVMTGILILFYFLPTLSPRRFEVDSTTRPIYLYVMLLIVGLLGYIHVLSLLAALKQNLDVGRAMVGGVFLIFVLLGNVLGKVPRNFYIGVRTPWTIADDRVWYSTHRLAAKVFVLGGLLAFLVVTVAGSTVAAFAIFLAVLLVPVVYSLIYYKQLQRRGEI